MKRPDLRAHDEASERAALGAMLIDGSQWPDFAATVKRDDFFLERNKVIYDVLQELVARDEAIDLVTAHHGLNGRSETIGGAAYLQDLINACPMSWNWRSYAAAIVETAIERRRAAALLEAGREIDAGDWRAAGQILIEADAGPQPQQAKRRYTLHTACEALEPQPPILWVVERLFSAGSVSLIVGEGGSKKTFSMLDAAVCVARGESWLNFSTLKAPVLIIDEESGKRRMYRRLGDVLRGHDAGPDTPIYFTSIEQFNLLALADVLAIEAAIEETKARLIFLDAMADVMPGGDENAVKDTQPVFRALRGIAERTDSAIVVIHHVNKAGQYRGSTAIKGAVDALIIVQSKPDDNHIDFDSDKTRDIEPFKFAALANFAEGSFNLSPTTPPEKQPHYTKGERYVIRYLQSNGGQASLVDIGAHADSVTDKTAKNAARALVERGITERIDEGGKGDGAIYALTSKGRLINA